MSLWLSYKQKVTPFRYTGFCPISLPVCAGSRHADVKAHQNKMLTNEEECEMDCCSLQAESARSKLLMPVMENDVNL